MEELSLVVKDLKFNRTKFYEPSNTLMCNFTVWIDSAAAIKPNDEIDAYNWYMPKEAKDNIKPNSLASEFLFSFLDETAG